MHFKASSSPFIERKSFKRIVPKPDEQPVTLYYGSGNVAGALALDRVCFN
jgi:hypothetical protein